MKSQAHIEGDRMHIHVDIEGEHHISNPFVEGEPSGSNHVNGNDQDNEFHDVIDNISINGEGSKADDIFEDETLDFDLSFPPMDKLTRNHPKDKILGDSNSGDLTRSHI